MMRRTILALIALLITSAGPLLAQTPDSVRGKLVDQDGKPLANQRVVLHRVVGSTGANVAETKSAADGAFSIPVEDASNTEAVYFLAARWEDELYIGEAFRAPFGNTEHQLQVGVPGTSASALIDGTSTAQMPPAAGMPPGAGVPQTTSGSPATRTSWLLFAIPGIALLGVIAYFLLRGRTSVPERRRLLAEVAELDLTHAASPTDEYRARRAALLDQLRDTPV